MIGKVSASKITPRHIYGNDCECLCGRENLRFRTCYSDLITFLFFFVVVQVGQFRNRGAFADEQIFQSEKSNTINFQRQYLFPSSVTQERMCMRFDDMFNAATTSHACCNLSNVLRLLPPLGGCVNERVMRHILPPSRPALEDFLQASEAADQLAIQ